MTKREIIDEWFLNVDSTHLKEGHFNAIELAMEEYAKQQLSLHIVSQQRELLGCEHNVITITDRDEGVCADCGVKMIRTWQPNCG